MHKSLFVGALALLAGTDLEGDGVLPHTWLVDRAGRLRGSHSGLVSERSLRQAVEALLDEPQPPEGELAAPPPSTGVDSATSNGTEPSSGP